MKNRISIIVISLVVLISCNQSKKVNKISGGNILISSQLSADTAMLNEISPYKDSISLKMNKVIGYNTKFMKERDPEGGIAHLFADVMIMRANKYLKEKKADSLQLFALINYKGLRTSLSKGKVTVNNIYQLMPFENEVVILTLPGDSVVSLFNFMGKIGGDGIGGATFSYENNKLSNVKIGNKKFDVNKNYFLVTSDYLANGGDYYQMIVQPIKREAINKKLRDIIIDYFKELNKKGKKHVPDEKRRIIIKS